jgi:protein-disulfide isomerase
MTEHKNTHNSKLSNVLKNIGTQNAILISGILISVSILLHGVIVSNLGSKDSATKSLVDKNVVAEILKKPVANRYFGDQKPTEEIIFTEYSDTECPFCKNFHSTISQIVEQGAGKYAWVYKHFPLSFHPNAQKEAEAIECVRSISGDTKAFQYMDVLYAITPSNNKLPLEALYDISDSMKLPTKKLKVCVENGTFAEKVKTETAEGAAAGVQGTPFTFVTQNKNGVLTEVGSINGAQPAEAIDAILSQIK